MFSNSSKSIVECISGPCRDIGVFGGDGTGGADESATTCCFTAAGPLLEWIPTDGEACVFFKKFYPFTGNQRDRWKKEGG